MMDESLTSSGLPLFPPLPASTDAKVVEKIRRILVVMGIGTTSAAQKVMEYFGNGAGEVKYFRNLTMIGDDMITVFYSSQATKKVKEAQNLVSVAVDPWGNPLGAAAEL